MGRTAGAISRGVRTVATVAVASVVGMTVAVSPAGARTSARATDEEAVVHSSGLDVDRRWTMTNGSRPAFEGRIRITNPTAAAITTDLYEPLPAGAKVTFTKGPKPRVSADIARYSLTVRPGRSTELRYTTTLKRDPANTPSGQLAFVQSKFDDALATVTPTPEEIAEAAIVQGSYDGGAPTVAEQSDPPAPAVPQVGEIDRLSMRLAYTDTTCTTPIRGCPFSASLFAPLVRRTDVPLTPDGPRLRGNLTFDLTGQVPATCGDVRQPVIADVAWTLAPAAARLTSAGWVATDVTLTMDETADVVAGGRCAPATLHTVTAVPMHLDA